MIARDRHWRSLAEWSGAPEFRDMVEREFPGRPWESLSPATRRQFLKIMGGSLALAGLAGCRWPKETIVPFSRPAGYTPGVPLRYATSMEIGGVATGLLVTSYDGRPIKIEGNPNHPGSLGATSAIAQASLLGLYDPSRSKTLVRRERGQALAPTWDDFAAFAAGRAAEWRTSGGRGLRVLCEASSSPSLARMRARLLEAFPDARWVEYEAVSREEEREGSIVAFGTAFRPQYALDKADVIVCLDADPLLTHPNAVRHARDFAARRRPERGPMNRLYAFESAVSLTGSVADHREAVPPLEIMVIARQLGAALLDRGIAMPGARSFWEEALATLRTSPGATGLPALAADLSAHRGRSAVIAGDGQPSTVHALAFAMNSALGNVGETITFTSDPDPVRPHHWEAIGRLAGEMRAGEVETLLLIGGNPAYDAPADLDLAAAFSAVPLTIRLGHYEDETSALSSWHLPRVHYLEEWGDARAYDGTLGVVQPLIEPLYGGRSPVEILSCFVDAAPAGGYDIVRETLRPLAGAGEFETFWRKLLDEGALPGSAHKTESPAVREEVTAAATTVTTPRDSETRLTLILRTDPKVHDGRFANNGWLQELPDPLTKITWGNAALIAPETAAALGVGADDVVTLETGRSPGGGIEIPAYVMPGQGADTIVVHLGYGRTAAGTVGNRVGTNAYPLRTTRDGHMVFDVAVRKTGRRHPLACTQDHHAIDMAGLRATQARLGDLVREATLDEYRRDPRFAKSHGHAPEPSSLWKEHAYDTGHQWAMAIDLGACIGCGACVIACQAENNVPVVGAEQVRRGREMHWLRVDRYFKGDPSSPEVTHQPVACVQCENAPCEQVCPVAATVHSAEGLNQQVYNRCVGTRYCSNNCPYKVRRFNWFNFHLNLTQIQKLAHNPEVTVRSRGVMEKCTFCVQRIEAVKIAAKNGRRAVRDGEIVPACAEACPAQAIVFGDLNDPESRVRRLHDGDRAYGLLAELGTRPRALHLAKVRNPAPGAASSAGPAGVERS